MIRIDIETIERVTPQMVREEIASEDVLKDDVEGGIHEVFKFDDRFWLTSTTFIPEDKIKEVHKVG